MAAVIQNTSEISRLSVSLLRTEPFGDNCITQKGIAAPVCSNPLCYVNCVVSADSCDCPLENSSFKKIGVKMDDTIISMITGVK